MTRSTTLLAAAALVLAACTSGPAGAPGDPSGPPDPAPPTSTAPGPDPWPATGPATAVPASVRLATFASCDALLDHYVEHALDLVGPWGLAGGPVAFAADGAAVAEQAAPAADEAGVGRMAGEDYSTTNVQEAGVDEPDVVKTDGEVIVTLVEDGLRVVDAAAGTVLGRLALPTGGHGAELLLEGDDLLVLSRGTEWAGVEPVADVAVVPAVGRTTITRVDLSDPAAPVVVGSTRLEGSYRSARMVDGTVRVVLVAEPTGLAFVQPEDASLAAEQEALETNRRIVAESDIDDWIPHLQVLDARGRSEGEVRRALDCAAIARPAEFSGLSTLAVLTLAIGDRTLVPTSGAGLVAAGDTVYASTDRLVVATSPWGQWVQPFLDVIERPRTADLHTDLHSFDITDPDATRHVASGSVTGSLIGQFALSEHDGILRVATTTEPEWWWGDDVVAEPVESQSSLVVLAERASELVEVGRVDGLGVTERIYAVRALGPDLVAIVTFRETDPLYLVDTSDPTAPVVTGELKIPGFSTYLHPVDGDRLVGIGQDADDRGQVLGLQASLFDVSDLASPERVDQVTFGEGWSPVEHDHRAFLHWAPTGQVVLPLQTWDGPVDQWDCPHRSTCPPAKPFVGAVVLEVDGSELVEQGRVALDDDAGEWSGEVRRALVVDDHLWLLAHDRLVRVTLDGLDDRTVVPLH